MLSNFNIECRKCRSQDVSIEYDNDLKGIEISCHTCENKEYIN